MQTRQPKLQSIQALRGIAALLVLIFHIGAMLGIESGHGQTKTVGAFWTQGYAGVDLFFVISGFIMVYVTAHLSPSLKASGMFLAARITRIYPLWWIAALFMMGYFLVAYGQPAPPDRVGANGVWAYTFKSLFLLPQEVTPVLGVGWTLIHEMLFYILFAAGLLLTRKFLPIWLGLWALLIGVTSMMSMPTNHAVDMWRLFSSPLNLEFILGAFAALLFLRGFKKYAGLLCLLGCVCFAIAMIIIVDGRPGVFLWKRVLAFGLPGAAIILGAAWLEQQGRLTVPAFLARIGDWSYSLYLTHFIVLLFLRRIWRNANDVLPESLRLGSESLMDNVIFIGLGIILSIIVAGMSYRLIEKPSLKLLRG